MEGPALPSQSLQVHRRGPGTLGLSAALTQERLHPESYQCLGGMYGAKDSSVGSDMAVQF